MRFHLHSRGPDFGPSYPSQLPTPRPETLSLRRTFPRITPRRNGPHCRHYRRY